jgi:hypothetical protein
VAKNEVFTIYPDNYTIHGLFINSEGYKKEKYVLVAIETSDNQIDFNGIHITKRPPTSFEYELRQYREVVPRFDTIDPIKQFVTIFTIQNGLDFNYACAIR